MLFAAYACRSLDSRGVPPGLGYLVLRRSPCVQALVPMAVTFSAPVLALSLAVVYLATGELMSGPHNPCIESLARGFRSRPALLSYHKSHIYRVKGGPALVAELLLHPLRRAKPARPA